MSDTLIETLGESLGSDDSSNVFSIEDRAKLEQIIQQETPFTPENITEIQTLLHKSGWGDTVGAIDGVMGPNTADGITNFVMHDSTIIRGERLGPNMDNVLQQASNDLVQDFQNVASQFQYPIGGMMPSVARGNAPTPSPATSQEFEPVTEDSSLYSDVFNTSMNGASFDTINNILAEGNLSDPETVQRLQIYMNAGGINVGRADGIMGELTSQGILNHVANSADAMASISDANLTAALETATPQAQTQLLQANPEFILNLEGEQLETMLDSLPPEALADFQSQLLASPEFRDMMAMHLDNGDFSNGSMNLISTQKLMTASGLYDRGIDGQMGAGTQAGMEQFNALEPLENTIVQPQNVQTMAL